MLVSVMVARPWSVAEAAASTFKAARRVQIPTRSQKLEAAHHASGRRRTCHSVSWDGGRQLVAGF